MFWHVYPETHLGPDNLRVAGWRHHRKPSPWNRPHTTEAVSICQQMAINCTLLVDFLSQLTLWTGTIRQTCTSSQASMTSSYHGKLVKHWGYCHHLTHNYHPRHNPALKFYHHPPPVQLPLTNRFQSSGIARKTILPRQTLQEQIWNV